MSSELIYDKQFIKAKKNGEEVFIPMVYTKSVAVKPQFLDDVVSETICED